VANTADKYAFWRYADLVERRIITDRNDLHPEAAQAGVPASCATGAWFTRRRAVPGWRGDAVG